MRIDSRVLFAAAALAAAMASPTPARATVYDISADFASATTSAGVANPNGVWSYGYLDNSSALGGTLHLYTDYAPNTSNGVRLDVLQSTNGFIGSVLSNESATTWVEGQQTVAAGWSGFNPGLGGQLGDVRFTAPAAGSYAISLTFEAGNSGANTLVSVTTDGDTLYSQAICGGSNTACGGQRSFGGTVQLAADQVLDITVADHGNNGFSDLTTLIGSVTSSIASPVPESPPIAMWLVGLGLLWTGAARRAKR